MKMGLKYATHAWFFHLLALILGLMFISGMGQSWFAVVLNAALVLAMAVLALNDGAYNGEKGCTLAASLEKQFKEGRRVDEKLKTQIYDRKVAAWILIIGALPFLLVSTVNAIVAPFYPEVVYEAKTQEEDTTGSFEFDYSDERAAETEPVNVVNVVARLVFMPFVSVYTLVRGNVLNALFFPFSLLLPGMEAIGYLCGPKMRMKKLKDIARGKKRKMRNLKVNKKPRQQRAEV